MNNQDLRILDAINTLSPTTFVSATEVSDKVEMDRIELGDRLMVLKKSGHVEIITRDYISSMTLPNFIAKARITEQGRKALKK
jgi:RIO-like serine/threonine protein kinase